ncbi:MAG: SusC/RagA family TonB-linked outer membrane protein, partial [Sphingobacteriales bacterium]
MRKLVLLCLTVILTIGELCAQSRTVTGKVTSSDGSPVPNVTIIVKGTTQGTATSTDGSYSLSVPESARVLVFSSVGMVSQDVTIGNRATIDVSLVSSQREMEEVVVVGYGTQKRREVTGAIGKIDPGPIAQLVSPSFDKQLAGRTPGLQVTNSSGLVNQPPRIRIRGVNSVNGNRAPLIVLDGVPTFSGGFSSTTNDNLLADINPSDIESIEVLKDGSATAIYGSRASNGVLLITTKKGKAGRFNVTYGATFGFTRPSKKFDLLNAAEFITIANEKLRAASLAEAAKPNAFNTDTDWQDAIFRDPAKSQIHNLTMEGGTERTNYFLSFNYTDQQGIVLTNAVKRYGVRANVEQKVGKWLKISNLITLSRTQDQDQNNGGNSLSGAIYNSLRALPNVRIYDTANKRYSGFNTTPDGAALGSDANTRLIENNNTNIAYVLAKNKLRSTKHRIINNLGLEIKPFSWLTYTAKANIDYITSSDFLAWDPLHGDGRSTSGRVSNTAQNTVRWVIQNYANAVKNFGDHNFNLTLGTESQNQEGNSFGAAGTNLSDAFFLQQNIISNSYSTQLSSGGYSQGPGFVSYFGRLNYDFAGKYFVQGSFRRDGLSRFAEDKRFGNFPGLSAGYRISNENFWLNSGLGKIFNEFKIRGSWAVVGNDQIVGGNFPYLSQYASAPYGAVSGIAISVVGNSDLEWESNEKLDVGVDFSMFEDRISVTVDYFKNKNNKLVFSDPLPVSFGVPGN